MLEGDVWSVYAQCFGIWDVSKGICMMRDVYHDMRRDEERKNYGCYLITNDRAFHQHVV